MPLRLRGSCGSHPASFTVDETQVTSTVSTSFALTHNLPRTVLNDGSDVRFSSDAPIVLFSPGGWYTFRTTLRVAYVEACDVVLGRDWVENFKPVFFETVLLDPLRGISLSHGVVWTQSPVDAVGADYAPNTHSADDLSSSSSSLGRGSSQLCATSLAECIRSIFVPTSAWDNMPLSDLLRISSNHDVQQLGHASGLREAVISHILTGQCHTGRGNACKVISGVTRLDEFTNLLRDRVTSDIQCSTDDRLVLIGRALAVEQSSSRDQLINGILAKLPCTPSSDLEQSNVSDTASELNVIEEMNLSSLRTVAREHNIRFPTDSSREVLRALISNHISKGSCFRRTDDHKGPSCRRLTSLQIEKEGGDATIDGQIRMLTAITPTLHRRALRRILDAHHVAYDLDSGVGQLRRTLKKYAGSLRKGKRLAHQRQGRHEAVTEKRSSREQIRARIKQEWPPNISPDLKQKLIRAFRRETSTKTLQTFTCAVCAARYPLSSKTTELVGNLPLDILSCLEDVKKTAPFLPMPDLSGYGLETGLLLEPKGMYNEADKTYVQMCSECNSCLRRSIVPPLSLANKVYRGPVPKELSDLTFIEEQIIARCRAKCCIIHMRTDKEDDDAPILPNTQRGFRGHIIVHPQRAEQLANVLPPTVEDIVTPICVIFVGSSVPSKNWLETKAKPLVARRERIRAALRWLKKNNPLYSSVEINEDRINDLPENGLLPYPTEHLPSTSAADSVTSRYDVSSTYTTKVDKNVNNQATSEDDTHISTKSGSSSVTDHANVAVDVEVSEGGSTIPTLTDRCSDGAPQIGSANPADVGIVVPQETDDAEPRRQSMVERKADCLSEYNIETRDVERQRVEFQKVVITDVDGHTPSSQLRAAAIRHIKRKGGGYLEIPHEPKPVNEFCNPTLFPMIYPILFPYGIGGFEDSTRKRSLSMRRHVRHLLNLASTDFQTHHTFLFTAFNILQRRAVLLNTGLKIRRDKFHSFADRFASVSEDAVARVCARVAETGIPSYENDEEKKVVDLMKEVQVVTRSVSGSSASRIAMRNEIRGLMATHGMPSFYITINPADIYNPIVKLLGGADIDVDNLLPEEVPNSWEQSILVAKNPFVGAKFFNLYMKAFIRELLGFDACNFNEEGGALGVVKAYYGCVEAQGRGTLHCHMMVWVEGGLSPSELQDKLRGTEGVEFGRRLVTFLDDVISNHLPDEIYVDGDPSRQSECHADVHRGFPLDMEEPALSAYRQNDLRSLVEANQIHSHTATCFKYCDKNEKECRFGLDEKNVIPESSVDKDTGELVLRILNGLVNNYNPTMLEVLRCNMDIQFIGTGEEAKAIIYYITDYITKSPLKAHVSYAALEMAIRRLAAVESSTTESSERVKRLLQRTAFALISNQELSAQQVASYLMDYEDHFTSHQFANLYWTSFERYVDKTAPLKRSPVANETDENVHGDNANGAFDEDTTEPAVGPVHATDEQSDVPHPQETCNDDEVAITGTADGSLVQLSTQLSDFIFRGSALHDMSLWEFVSGVRKDTHRAGTESSKPESESAHDTEDEFMLPDEVVPDGRRRTSVRFRQGHPEKDRKCSVVLDEDHQLVPVLIGPSLPRADREQDKERYARLMLILFKPWTDVRDLKGEHETWEAAFENQRDQLCSASATVMKNLQLLHECRDSRNDHITRGRDRKRRNRTSHVGDETSNVQFDDALMGPEDEQQILNHLENMASARAQYKDKERARVQNCLDAANRFDLFSVLSSSVRIPDSDETAAAAICTTRDLESKWRTEYDERRKEWKRFMATNPNEQSEMSANATATLMIGVRDLQTIEDHHNAVAPSALASLRDPIFEPTDNVVHIEQHVTSWKLNTEQARAFRIVAAHSVKQKPAPLRMYLGGVGGTGKSRVIQALTSFFAARNQSRRLRLASFTGVAARNILGTTLHAALGLDQRRGSKLGQKTRRDLEAMWDGVDYLLIDEISMVGCKMFTKISEALSEAKGDPGPFGGVNMIVAGDFAQLPPVSETRLYAWVKTSRNASLASGQDVVMGKLLWLSFNTVVILREVMRQRGDTYFVSLLSRLREGRCTDEDYQALSKRVLGYVGADGVRVTAPVGAPIIVNDNATKDALNVRAAEAFAKATGQRIQWYHARDTHNGQQIRDETLMECLVDMHSGQTSHRLGKIPLVFGMPVIISQNYDVSGGIVNGSIGTLKRIRYAIDDGGSNKKYLKSCIVHLEDAEANQMGALDKGHFPVLEDTVSMTFIHPHSRSRCTIKRQQVPVQPAFAITAHKAQGQTFKEVIIDLAGCSGTEAPYVMLSRATSLEGVTILRPFEKSKITCRPSEDLRKEHDRLDSLALCTIIEYGSPDEVAKAEKALREKGFTISDEDGRLPWSAITSSTLPGTVAERQRVLVRIQERVDSEYSQQSSRKHRQSDIQGTSTGRPAKRLKV